MASGFWVVLVFLAPMLLCFAALLIWRMWYRNRQRRSPLVDDLLRQPAQGLRIKLDDLNWELIFSFCMVGAAPMFLVAVWAIQTAQLRWSELWTGASIVYPIGALALIFWFVIQAVRRMNDRQRYLEAVDAELATAQALEHLVARGCRVLHDIPFAYGNIDHVVIGPGGVFTVETKSRYKPVRGRGAGDATVTHEGQMLKFPDWTETKPLEQAKVQARWLEDLLRKSVGKPQRVRPVVALPGWAVKWDGRADVLVMNPKNCDFMARPLPEQPEVSVSEIKQIVQAVEQHTNYSEGRDAQRRNERRRPARVS